MYIELKSGRNDCYWNVRGICTYDLYKRVTPNFSTSNRDWDSKRNCTVTQLGTQLCSAYKQEPV